MCVCGALVNAGPCKIFGYKFLSRNHFEIIRISTFILKTINSTNQIFNIFNFLKIILLKISIMSKIQFFSILFVCSIIGNVWTAPAFNPNSYRQAIINYGRTLNRDISQKLVRKIYSFNGQIREYAGGIPSDSALRELAVPLHFSSNIGNMIAPYVVRRFVTKPIEIATDHIANWVDHINSSLKPFSDTISATLGNGRKI
uniref:Uncharacterized protein LOC113789213 n=1 Tax=Dermatophagoides pteronyssinus TaxID=6956 RepID=A0A6P6XP23_DERPT|nr:uncharacterized protein LOC113789213 [Dermatophagoides pteronyssinus]